MTEGTQPTIEEQLASVDQQKDAAQVPPAYDGSDDPDPSAASGRGGRLNRTTVVVIFGIAALFASIVMGVIMYHFFDGSTQHAHSAELAQFDSHESASDTDTGQQDMSNAQRAAQSDSDVTGAGTGDQSTDQSATGKGQTTDSATAAPPTPSPEQLAAQERAQHQLDELKHRDDLALQAYSADAAVGDATSSTQSTAPAGLPAPTPPGMSSTSSAPPEPDAGNGKFILRATDYIDGLLVPNLNAERAGVVKIAVRRAVTDTATHTITLIPMGATIRAQLNPAAVGLQRIGLTGVQVQYQTSGPWLDLGEAVVGDADGTLGLSAHVDMHTRQALTIAGIGGAMAALSQGAFGGVNISPGGGVTATAPNVAQQVAGGVGAGILQQGAQMATQASAMAPTLTAPEAKPVTLTLDRDLALEPYCDPTVPNSIECRVKEYLNESNP